MCVTCSCSFSMNESNWSTSSPGSINTAWRVRSQPTTKPFLKNGPTAALSRIIRLGYLNVTDGRRRLRGTPATRHAAAEDAAASLIMVVVGRRRRRVPEDRVVEPDQLVQDSRCPQCGAALE